MSDCWLRFFPSSLLFLLGAAVVMSCPTASVCWCVPVFSNSMVIDVVRYLLTVCSLLRIPHLFVHSPTICLSPLHVFCVLSLVFVFSQSFSSLSLQQMYDNISPLMTEAFKYLTPLSLDVFSWVLLFNMQPLENPRLKQDGVNLEDWLQCLGALAGHFYARYTNVDMSALLTFVVNQVCVQVVPVSCHNGNVDYFGVGSAAVMCSSQW